MSIIYDALKKVRVDTAKIDNTPGLPPKPENRKLLKYAAYLLAVGLGFISTSMLFKLNPNLLSPNQQQMPDLQAKKELPLATPALTYTPPPEELMSELATAAKPASPTLVLNGLLLSQDGRYAIVNNQIVKEGDVIEGAVVKRISSSGVNLDFKGENLRLGNAN